MTGTRIAGWCIRWSCKLGKEEKSRMQWNDWRKNMKATPMSITNKKNRWGGDVDWRDGDLALDLDVLFQKRNQPAATA